MRTARLLTVSQHALRRGVYLPGGVPAGRCTCPGMYLPGGVPAQGVVVYPSMHWGRPPYEQNDWQTGVKTQPSQTSFAGGKNNRKRKKHNPAVLPRTVEGHGFAFRLLQVMRSRVDDSSAFIMCYWTSLQGQPNQK